MKPYKSKICWITGASSGIGEALSFALAEKGARLILSARRIDRLKSVQKKCLELGAEEVTIIALDLGQSQSIAMAFHTFRSKFTQIDYLFSNGGISQRSTSLDTSIEVERDIMEVNYFGTIQLTKLVLGVMKEQGNGHLAVTSSIAGKFGFPLRTTYSASKHALQGYFESLRTELLPYNINVSIVIPGRVKTEISLHAVDGAGTAHGKMDEGQNKGISSKKAAQQILNGIAKRKKEILVGSTELLMVQIRRFFPWLFYKIVARIKPT